MISEKALVEEIKTILREWGVDGLLDAGAPIIEGLGLDDEDWCFDVLPEIEKRYGLSLDPILLTGETRPPGCIGRLFGSTGTPVARDLSIEQIARYVYEQQRGG